MKAIAAGITASALLVAVGLAGLAGAQAPQAPVVLEGKDKPILLGRMVVTATALPARD